MKSFQLQELIDKGIIKYEDVRVQYIMLKHDYKIYQEKSGRWRTLLPSGKTIRRNTKADVEKAVVKYYEEAENNPTLDDIFEEWNKRREDLKQIDHSTHYRYNQDWNRFFYEFGKSRIKNIEDIHILNFVEEQVAYHSLTAKGLSSLKLLLRGVFKYARKNKLTTININDVLEDVDISEKALKTTVIEDQKEVFDEFEMSIAIDYLTENLDVHNLAIIVIFVSGCRIGEIVSLKPEDVSPSYITVRRTETKYRSNGKYVYEVKEKPKTRAGYRTVVIPSEYHWVLELMKERSKNCEYVFTYNGHRITANSVRSRLRRVCDKLQIVRKSPHKIRKTYLTILLDSGLDQNFVKEQAGHTTIGTTEQHYHRNRKSLLKKQEIMDKIPDFH